MWTLGKMKGIAVAALALALSSATPSAAQVGFDGDADPDNPTLRVQPPLLPLTRRVGIAPAPAGVVNGITYLDVMLAAGYDLSGYDYGYEPGITVNPGNPNQIVITPLAGSDWFVGGNAAFFYSADGGASWAYVSSIPPPPGISTGYCPCDETMDWGRDGVLYATFLTSAGVYSAQSDTPTESWSWIYRPQGSATQSTNLATFSHPDQPWLFSGPLPEDASTINVCVAYDAFDSTYTSAHTRTADSPGAIPLDFTRDAATTAEGTLSIRGMNPGNRIAVGRDGKIFTVYQRSVGGAVGGVRQLTYLASVSVDGGLSWHVANSDHASGAKIVAANVYSFQGNGSKIGGVNALMGGIDAIAADPATGAAWVVYGSRATQTSHDQLYLAKLTYSAGSLVVGTPVLLTGSAVDNYLPAVAVLPNGEVGVLFLTLNGSTFQWRFVQYANGATLVKTTDFPAFTSPFSNDGSNLQRVLGDYIQLRASGCAFFGTYPARGTGVNNVGSIDPYFMSAPAAGACTLPTATGVTPSRLCAGGQSAYVTVQGTGFSPWVTARINGGLRPTTYLSDTQVNMLLNETDLAAASVSTIDVLGAPPSAGLTNPAFLMFELPATSPGSSLREAGAGPSVNLSWGPVADATSFNVKRCTATAGPCVPGTIASVPSGAYQDNVRQDGANYWYQVESVNSCGAVP